MLVNLFHDEPRSACKRSPLDFYDLAQDNQDNLREVCDTCPVFQSCLSYAVPNEIYGWWANTNENERKAIRKQSGIPTPTLWAGVHGGLILDEKHKRERERSKRNKAKARAIKLAAREKELV